MPAIDDKILLLRSTLKLYKQGERSLIPLPSVLQLQFLRAEYVTMYYTSHLTEAEHIQDYGYHFDKKGNLLMTIQDVEDKFYKTIKEITSGCNCKLLCSNRCSCKQPLRASTCTPLTCKVKGV